MFCFSSPWFSILSCVCLFNFKLLFACCISTNDKFYPFFITKIMLRFVSFHHTYVEAKKNYTLRPRVVLPDSYVKGELWKKL